MKNTQKSLLFSFLLIVNVKSEEKLKVTRHNIARFWSGKEAPQQHKAGNKHRHTPPAAACTLACKLKDDTIKISVRHKHDSHMGQNITVTFSRKPDPQTFRGH